MQLTYEKMKTKLKKTTLLLLLVVGLFCIADAQTNHFGIEASWNDFYSSKTSQSVYDNNFKGKTFCAGTELGIVYSGKLSDKLDFSSSLNYIAKDCYLSFGKNGYNNVTDFWCTGSINPSINSCGLSFDVSRIIKKFNKGYSLGLMVGSRIGHDVASNGGGIGTYRAFTKEPADTFNCEGSVIIKNATKWIPEIYGGIRFNKDVDDHRLFTLELCYYQDMRNTSEYYFYATINEGSLFPNNPANIKSSQTFEAKFCPMLSFINFKFILYPFFAHSKKEPATVS
jgi:hypothetical protein